MIPTLIAVTLISLTFALAMLVVVWRLLREEHRRSAARVAMLEAASLAQHDEVPPPVLNVEAVRPKRDPIKTEVVSRTPMELLLEAADGRPSGRHHQSAISADPEPGNDEHEAVTPVDRGLFASTARPARSARRFGMVAAVGLIVVGTAATIAVSWNLKARQGQATPAAVAAEMVSSRSPLELVSLAHRRDGDGMTVTGLIRNPADGAPIKSLTAVVFFFGRDGAFLTSARAPVDYSTLLPGDESPFVVTVRQPGSVGRYRVSFRTDERVVPHVDRREDARFARSER